MGDSLKYIFLDCDGVLNCSGTRIDPWAVKRLKQIVDATGAKIVVSSVWRFYYYHSLRISLAEYGFDRGVVIGKTGATRGEIRGNDIQAWLDANDPTPEAFVILDDDSDMLHLMPYLIKTSWKTGLLDEHVEQAIEKLGRKEAS